MPSEEFSHPMIDARRLEIPSYRVAVIEVFESDTGNISSLWPVHNVNFNDKSIILMEIHPIEAGNIILFASPSPIGTAFPALSLANIMDIKKTSRAKGVFKKKDILIEISFKGNDNKRYRAVIDVEDKYADEIIQTIRSTKKLMSDPTYCIHGYLTIPSVNGSTTRVSIYPQIPFLAYGEEIIWEALYIDEKTEKVFSINVVTNYRIFEYDYDEHKGICILLSLLDDVRIVNKKNTRDKDQIGKYLLSSYSLLPKIDEQITTKFKGDITFYGKGRSTITFVKITDPDTLASAVKVLKEKQSKVLFDISTQNDVGPVNGIEINISQQPPKINDNMCCNKCGNNNPKGSLFCNKCGSQIVLVSSCNKCGFTNESDAAFCSQCGSKIGTPYSN